MTDEHGTYRWSKLRRERDKTFLGRREAHAFLRANVQRGTHVGQDPLSAPAHL